MSLNPLKKPDTQESDIRSSRLPTSITNASSRIPSTLPHMNANRNPLIDDQDDEETAFQQAQKAGRISHVSNYLNDANDPTLLAIQNNMNELKKRYPTGGIKASRYVTAAVLMKAPDGYFDVFEDEIQNGVQYVRDELAGSGASDVIRDAQDNPTDDAYQDKAFFKVQSLASEYMSRSRKGWGEIQRATILSFICNEVVGFGRLEPLWRDSSIDEIMCNGPRDVQVEIRGEVRKVPGCKFKNSKHLLDLIDRLYSAIGKTVSQTTPLVKGRLHDKSRMFAVHPTIAPDGPNFSIRRHPSTFWTPSALVRRGSSSEEVMSFIGNMVHKGASFLVSGGTHSGKTSMLNAITGFYKPAVRILTLEDNIEMKPNPKKLLAAAMECRMPAMDRGNDHGVTMRDLVKASLQMRPDVIIVGEVTDDAAYDLCQALNTGHAGASTIHANSSQEAIPRLSSLIAQGGLVTTEGALELIASAFDFIVSLKHFPLDGSRRIISVDEVGREPMEINGRLTLPVNPIWKFVDDGLDENNKVTGHWVKVGDISTERRANKLLDIEEDLDWAELQELSSIVEQELPNA